MVYTTTRSALVRDLLLDRRRELQKDIRGRIRDARADRPHAVRDDLEASDASASEEVEFALVGMKADTLSRIDTVLATLHPVRRRNLGNTTPGGAVRRAVQDVRRDD